MGHFLLFFESGLDQKFSKISWVFLKKNQENGQVQDKKKSQAQKQSTGDEQYLNVISIRNRKTSEKAWQKTWEMHRAVELIHLQFAEALSEMVSLDMWLFKICS